MTRVSRIIGLWAVFVTVAIPSARAAGPVNPNPNLYIVEEGDTCLGIASKIWPGDPDGLERIHAFNALGPLPHNLVPGQKINLASTTPDATITFLKPDVNVRPAGMPEWAMGKVGQGLFNRDQLSTLFGAAAEVLFRDKSVLQLDQNALVTIYGVVKTTHTPTRSGAIELVQGDMRVKLAAMRGEAQGSISVTTPSAHVSAKSQHMLVGVDEKKMSRVSVFEGSAQVVASGKTIDLSRGFGTRVEEGKAPEPAVELPSAPKWMNSGNADVFLALTDAGAAVTVRWAPVSTADSYRVELASDDVFNVHIADKKVKRGEQLELAFKELPKGRYFARVSSLTTTGLSGPPSSTRRVDVAPAVLEAGTLGKQPGTIRGSVEVRMKLPPGAGLSGVVDDKPMGESIRVRGMGPHTIKIVNSSGAPLSSFLCQIDEPLVSIGFPPGLKYVTIEFFDKVTRKPISFMEAKELSLSGIEGTRVDDAVPQPGGHEWRANIVPHRVMANTMSATVAVLWNKRPIKAEEGHETR